MQTPGGVVALRSSEIRQLVASRTRACMVCTQEGSLACLLDFIVCGHFYLLKMFLNLTINSNRSDSSIALSKVNESKLTDLTTLFGRCMINCSTR